MLQLHAEVEENIFKKSFGSKINENLFKTIKISPISIFFAKLSIYERFEMGYRNYEAGEWQDAVTFFEATLDLTNGPGKK